MSIRKFAAASFACGITFCASAVSAHSIGAAIANDHAATDSRDIIINIAKKEA